MSFLSLGPNKIHRVQELSVTFPLTYLGADEALIERHAAWLFPHFSTADRTFEMVFQSFILEADERIILVDPCVGNGRAFPTLPMFDNLNTPYIDRFCATGIRPEDVDYVVCTHLHSDHCGWNTHLRDGRYVPTFPNARYIIVQTEYDRWDPKRPGYVHQPHNAGVFENSVAPVLEAGLADLVPEIHHVTENLLLEPAHGHTAGHSSLTLSAGPQEACFTGDTFHHPLELFAPELALESCEDPATTLATRRRLIARFLERGTLIIPAHFSAPHAGWLRQDATGTVFAPAETLIPA